jgi:hypothetical protein
MARTRAHGEHLSLVRSSGLRNSESEFNRVADEQNHATDLDF